MNSLKKWWEGQRYEFKGALYGVAVGWVAVFLLYEIGLVPDSVWIKLGFGDESRMWEVMGIAILFFVLTALMGALVAHIQQRLPKK